MTKTEIRFVSGFDPVGLVPRFVKSAGLKYRFAVIQETYRPDSVDMYFDAALWRCLFEFAKHYLPGFGVKIITRWDGVTKISADDFLVSSGTSIDHPPGHILVPDKDNLVLCISTEYWTQVGGPWPYHDSFTYSIFSNMDLAGRVIQSLREADASSGWDISPEMLPPTRKRSFWKKLLG